ncbi:MAG: hypothetical protein FJW19_03425 [Actinobacteria bacterium]|nr:hypothetical protein [Actinomycetota bacterium]
MSNKSPSVLRMLTRGLFRRCPHCGWRGAFFVSWFRTQKTCRGCNLVWQRNLEGFMLGALAINFIVTGSALLATLVTGVAVTYPDIAILELLVSTVGVTLLVGVFGYPISYTLWLAVDLSMRPLDADELACLGEPTKG